MKRGEAINQNAIHIVRYESDGESGLVQSGLAMFLQISALQRLTATWRAVERPHAICNSTDVLFEKQMFIIGRDAEEAVETVIADDHVRVHKGRCIGMNDGGAHFPCSTNGHRHVARTAVWTYR